MDHTPARDVRASLPVDKYRRVVYKRQYLGGQIKVARRVRFELIISKVMLFAVGLPFLAFVLAGLTVNAPPSAT